MKKGGQKTPTDKQRKQAKKKSSVLSISNHKSYTSDHRVDSLLVLKMYLEPQQHTHLLHDPEKMEK